MLDDRLPSPVPERRGATAGIQVGILTLPTRHQLVLGNVQHAQTFPFRVAYAPVEASLDALMCGDPAVFPEIERAIRLLERLGVDLIVGACGSFGHYQRPAADISRVPICLSILVQVPFVLTLIGAGQKLGIVFARTSAFTERVREECAIGETSRIVAIGADALSSFAPILDSSLDLDSTALERDLVSLLRDRQMSDPSIGAWLLQCSDLPPYGPAIAAATGLPVFDMTLLITHLQQAVARTAFQAA